MKFSSSTTFFALASVVVVSALPAPLPGSVIAPTGVRTVDMGSSDMVAVMLDPTFEDGAEDGVMSINAVAATSSAKVASSARVTAMGGGIRTLPGRVISTSTTPAGGYSNAKPTSTKTVVNYTTGPPVVVTIPGKTSTATSTRYYTPAPVVKPPVAASSAKPSSQAVVSAQGGPIRALPSLTKGSTTTTLRTQYMPTSFTTVTMPQGTVTVMSTIPGKTGIVTIYRSQAWPTRPASAINHILPVTRRA